MNCYDDPKDDRAMLVISFCPGISQWPIVAPEGGRVADAGPHLPERTRGRPDVYRPATEFPKVVCQNTYGVAGPKDAGCRPRHRLSLDPSMN